MKLLHGWCKTDRSWAQLLLLYSQTYARWCTGRIFTGKRLQGLLWSHSKEVKKRDGFSFTFSVVQSSTERCLSTEQRQSHPLSGAGNLLSSWRWRTSLFQRLPKKLSRAGSYAAHRIEDMDTWHKDTNMNHSALAILVWPLCLYCCDLFPQVEGNDSLNDHKSLQWEDF